ncbi:MAG: HAD family phosphatase [Clostridiales bacterium]|nr:HAD family phosphatase [Clostridiales bacterium]
MRKINYPLIVSDFDGTLVKKDGTISEKNKKAIDEYVAAGGRFAISTGRMPAGILNRARELGLKGMVCCCQGAIIVDIESGKVISDGRVSHETTLKACEIMEELGLHIHVYDLWEYYVNMEDDHLDYYENAVKVKAIRVLDKPISQFVKETGLCSYKILAMVAPEDNARIKAELSKHVFEGCEITKSALYLIEIVNTKYSKGTAVETLAKTYGIPLEKTIGIGDQTNDLPMIQTAGLGVAVKNADDGLKAEADYVCDLTHEEDAVAYIIEKFGFTEE